jgi:hypothetical protein
MRSRLLLSYLLLRNVCLAVVMPSGLSYAAANVFMCRLRRPFSLFCHCAHPTMQLHFLDFVPRPLEAAAVSRQLQRVSDGDWQMPTSSPPSSVPTGAKFQI